MYITEIEITNLRSFKGRQSVSLAHADGGYAGWTVFVGRNGAGKSTLLKSIALSVIGPLASRSLAGTFSGWVRLGEKSGTVAVRLQGGSRDSFQPGLKTKEPFWVGLQWTSSEYATWTSQTNDFLDRWMTKEPEERQDIAERGPWKDTPKGWFVAGYGPYRHLGPPPAEVIKLSGDPVLARLVNLFNETATLSDAIDWLKQLHHRSLEKRPGAEDLKSTVLEILGEGLLPDGSVIKKINSDGLWILRDGVELPLEEVSDGYRTVAALVVDILRRLYKTYGTLEMSKDVSGKSICKLPGVIIIDEVDAHLHVAWQQKIGFWLTKTFPLIQFLVTTHSPFICQAASANGIIRLPAPGDSRSIEHLSEATWSAVVNGGVDDAVMTDLFGLEHAHSERAEQLRREIATLEAKVIRKTATEADLARYEMLKDSLGKDMGTLADLKLRAILGTNS